MAALALLLVEVHASEGGHVTDPRNPVTCEEQGNTYSTTNRVKRLKK